MTGPSWMVSTMFGAGDEVDLPSLELRWRGVIRLDGLEGEVEPLGHPGQACPAGVLLDPFDVVIAQTEHSAGRSHRGPVASIAHVDPEKPLRPERTDKVVGRVHPLVMAVGVEQSGR